MLTAFGIVGRHTGDKSRHQVFDDEGSAVKYLVCIIFGNDYRESILYTSDGVLLFRWCHVRLRGLAIEIMLSLCPPLSIRFKCWLGI